MEEDEHVYKLVTTTDGYLYFGKWVPVLQSLSESAGRHDIFIALSDCHMLYNTLKEPLDIAVSGLETDHIVVINGANITEAASYVEIHNPSLVIELTEKAIESIKGAIEAQHER